MLSDQIITCLEQKKILLTSILNLTKQIEVRSSQPDIVLDDFLERREVYMQRAGKCDHLISDLLNQLPEDQQKHLRELLDPGKKNADMTAADDAAEKKERTIAVLSEDCATLKQQAAVLDRSAYITIERRRGELKDRINQSRSSRMRNSNSNHSMFQI